MAISQLPQAPYRQDRKIFPTPLVADILFSEVRDCTRSEFPEYGTPHPNPNKWPHHKLVFIKTVDIERDGIFEFFYAAERQDQDLYNFASGYRNVIGNAGGREFRVVQRSYLTLRDAFQPLDIEFGTPMPNVPEGVFDDVEYVFFDRQQQKIEQQELESLFVAEVHTYIEKVFLEYKLSYGAQKSDVVPEKFRALIPQTSTEQIVEGLAQQPTLTGSQLSVTQDQINPDIKVVKTVSRADQQSGYTLSGKQITNDLQVASVVETLVPDGTTIEATGLTVDGSVESLGNGQSLQRIITVPELFASESYSSQIPDPVPEKFRALSPTTSKEENVFGTAAAPSLAEGELEATEQQVNKFVKRKRNTKRDVTVLPVSLTQKSTTNDKQLATITETLQVTDSAEAPTATVDIESQALGDGTYVVRKVELPELFTAETFSIQIPETIPEKFRAEIPTVTVQSNKAGQASEPTLGDDELESSQQQLNAFVYREQITKRDTVTEVALPTVERAYVSGTIAKVSEKLSADPDIESGFLVAESQAVPIGDDKFIVQTVKVDAWPVLRSSEWDPVLNTQVVRTEEFVAPPTVFSEQNTAFRAENKDRTLKIVEEPPTSALSNYVLSYPTQVDLQLPNVLKKLEVIWTESTSVGGFDSNWLGFASGTSGSLSGSESGNATSSVSLKPELVIDIEQPWGSDLPATAHFFFVESVNNAVTEAMILSKLTDIVGGASAVSVWPTFKPVSHTIILQGSSGSVRANVTGSGSSSFSNSETSSSLSQDKTEGSGTEYDIGISLNAVTLPPTIHGAITIANAQLRTKEITAFAKIGWQGFNFPTVLAQSTARKTVEADVNPKTLAATSRPAIPTSGVYLVKSSIEPYKWGWVKCAAVVVDAAVLA